MDTTFIERHVPLGPLTTMGVGGRAEHFARCRTSEQLSAALAFAAERRLAITVLGGGSNVVIADRGLDGLVIQLATSSIDVAGDGDHAEWHVAGGLVWDDLVARSVEEEFGGLECLSGIPGLVGAAPMQNIGAYGQEVSSTITAVWAVDRRTGETERFDADACGFGYRTSHFKTAWRDQFIVTRVDFRLSRAEFGETSYAGIGAYLVDRSLPPTLDNVRRAVIAVRRSKSMVIDPDDENSRSCGSFFTNPVVTADEAARVEAIAGGESPMPRYPADDGVKIPAAWLIEAAGLERGFARGPVGLSSRHTLAIVNRGGATARDVAALARHIRSVVHERFGVSLVPEPVFLGDVDGG